MIIVLTIIFGSSLGVLLGAMFETPMSAILWVLAAMLLGSSEVVPVSEGRLVLGQYQSIMLVELDGPRERNVAVQMVGE